MTIDVQEVSDEELREEIRLSKLTRSKRDPRYSEYNTAWAKERRKTWTEEEWEAHRQRNRNYYDKNKLLVFERVKKRKAANKLKAIEYKGGKCQKCDQIYAPQAMDFHHPNDDKSHNPGRLMSGAWETLIKELDKCVLLCANCHREEHSG